MSRSDKQRGLYNSSLTRVEPSFDAILQENGWQKFFDLVRSKARGGMQGGDRLPDGFVKLVRSQYGSKKSMGGGEEAIPPHRELLDWLIDHAGTGELKKPGKDAGAERKSLFLNPNERDFVRQKAHDEIAAAVCRNSYPRKWFVLEGATRPDVYIKTDRFTLLIEGKRTEDHFTRETTWMKHRDQMIRHMDAAYPIVESPLRPVFGLYIFSDADDEAFQTERKFPNLQSGIGWYHDKQNWLRSMPHRRTLDGSEDVVAVMQRRFLGYITWNDLLSVFPNAKDGKRWK